VGEIDARTTFDSGICAQHTKFGHLGFDPSMPSSRVTLVGPSAIHLGGHNVDQLDALSRWLAPQDHKSCVMPDKSDVVWGSLDLHKLKDLAIV
jgi:hypothetical protein